MTSSVKPRWLAGRDQSSSLNPLAFDVICRHLQHIIKGQFTQGITIAQVVQLLDVKRVRVLAHGQGDGKGLANHLYGDKDKDKKLYLNPSGWMFNRANENLDWVHPHTSLQVLRCFIQV